jgi:hypothetical protein
VDDLAILSPPPARSASPPSSSPTSPDNPSLTVKHLRLERRAERTKSAGLKKVLAVRSRSRSTGPVGDRTPLPEPAEMTLDDLGPLPTTRPRSSSTIAFPMSPPPRTPSPDIENILSATPRPALRKAASQSRIRSPGIIRKRITSASDPDYRRRASEGVIREMRSAPSWHGHDSPESQRNRTLSQSSHAEGEFDESEKRMDEKNNQDGDDSDSSLDLHTPLP